VVSRYSGISWRFALALAAVRRLLHTVQFTLLCLRVPTCELDLVRAVSMPVAPFLPKFALAGRALLSCSCVLALVPFPSRSVAVCPPITV